MAFDLGELVGYVGLDSLEFERKYEVIQRELRALARLSPEVQVSADTSTATGNLAEVAAAARALPDGQLQVDADVSSATSDLAEVEATARALPDGELTVDADTSSAVAKIRRLTNLAEGDAEFVAGVTLPVGGDTGPAQDAIGALTGGDFQAGVQVQADADAAVRTLAGLTAGGQFVELLVAADDDEAQQTITDLRRKAEQAAQMKVVAEADFKDAEARLDRLVNSQNTAEIDIAADPDKAQAVIDRLAAAGTITTIDVRADPAAARAVLDRLAGERRDVTVQAQADVAAAQAALAGLQDDAEQALGEAGEQGGKKMGAGILGALVALPIAGTIIALGATIGKALLDGLENEVREDRLAATTGLDQATVKRLATAAGEAYGANFGESIAANMDTARVAIQSGLLDPDATARDSQAVIEQLSGVTDILGEDIPRVSRAVGVLLRTGLAKDAGAAFDILVKGAQSGANVAEDLVDTFTEYPAVLAKLGLSGEQSLGLLSQGMQAGARDTDFVADALKEFQIRATDASTASAAGFAAIGLNAADMTAKIAAGGAGAREGLDQVLDGLRGIEDPVARNAAAVALFGTKAEDLGDALYALDLDTIAADLGKVEGAASGAISTLGDNAAGQLESAKRNITLAADGIKGALAAAFAPQIEGFATFVQENRAAVMTFLLDMANGALDAGRALVEGAAAGIEAYGQFVRDTGPKVIDTLLAIVIGLDAIPGIDLSGPAEALITAREGMIGLADGTVDAADALRTNLIENGLDPAQARLNEFGLPLVAQAAFHDATVALAADIGGVGYGADGTKLSIDNLSGSFDKTTGAGAQLDGQIRAAVASLDANVRAGAEAGEAVDSLTGDYGRNRAALVKQIEAMGFTKAEAERLADAYGAIPADKRTKFIAETAAAAADVAALKEKIDNLDRNVMINITNAIRTVRYEEIVRRGGNTGGGLAGGGRLPGGPSSVDSLLTPTAPGEWIINAYQAAKHDRLLDAINSGTYGGAAVAPSSGMSASPTDRREEVHQHTHFHLDSAVAARQADAYVREANAADRRRASLRSRVR